jgi:hypothetical protein
MGRRRGVGVHRRRQNRPRELADLRRFGDEFLRSGDVSREEGKGGRGRSAGGFYRRCFLAEGARVCARRGDGRPEGVGLEWVSCQRMGPSHQREEGVGCVPLRVCPGMGRGPNVRSDRFGPLGPFLFFLFIFFFLNFELIQNLLQTCFNQFKQSSKLF